MVVIRNVLRRNAFRESVCLNSRAAARLTMDRDYSLQTVRVALTPQQRFEEYLQSKKMRNTEPRRLLVDHVFRRHDHFDAESLIEQLPSKGTDGYVGRATVYRTLDELVNAGLLRKFELDGRAVFEHDYGYPEHDHLYCKQCQRLIEFQSAELGRLVAEVAADHQFRMTGHRLIVSGVCSDCSRNRRRTAHRQDRV